MAANSHFTTAAPNDEFYLSTKRLMFRAVIVIEWAETKSRQQKLNSHNVQLEGVQIYPPLALMNGTAGSPFPVLPPKWVLRKKRKSQPYFISPQNKNAYCHTVRVLDANALFTHQPTVTGTCCRSVGVA